MIARVNSLPLFNVTMLLHAHVAVSLPCPLHEPRRAFSIQNNSLRTLTFDPEPIALERENVRRWRGEGEGAREKWQEERDRERQTDRKRDTGRMRERERMRERSSERERERESSLLYEGNR